MGRPLTDLICFVRGQNIILGPEKVTDDYYLLFLVVQRNQLDDLYP